MQNSCNPAASATMAALREAKAHSDCGDYRRKSEVLRKLLADRPDEFVVDDPGQGGGIVGLTHTTSNFRIHAPRSILPDSLRTDGSRHD